MNNEPSSGRVLVVGVSGDGVESICEEDDVTKCVFVCVGNECC